MEYRMETSERVEYWEDWEKVKRIWFEHGEERSWYGSGNGPWYYIYIDDQPALAVRSSEVLFFHDWLVTGDFPESGYLYPSRYYNGVHAISLRDYQADHSEVKSIEVEGYFDSFKVDRDVLYVFCMHDVMAFDGNLNLLWKTGKLSEDGVVFKYIEGDTMTVECTAEPMSEKWFDHTISLLDGSSLNETTDSKPYR